MADSPVPPMKPGYLTTEFWLHVLVGLAIYLLTRFNPAEAGLPPFVQAAYSFIAPIALAWLAKNYGDSRTELKAASIAGAAAAANTNTEAKAAAVLRGG